MILKSQLLQRFLNRPQRRFIAARPGSVLILVIVLLVLLALLGTAYISTSRNGRLTTAQNLNNTQTDLHVEGVSNIVVSKVLGGLFDSSGNFKVRTFDRGAYDATATYAKNDVVYNGTASASYGDTYVSIIDANFNQPLTNPAAWTPVFSRRFDSASNNTTPWLADRIPHYDIGSAHPYWQNTSSPFLSSGVFEAPDIAVSPSGSQPAVLSGTRITQLFPTFKTIISGTYPALDSSSALGTPIIACDADNDGIADSLLVRIPGSYSDGLTWYAGVRVIDNNSAINANTAWSRDNEFNFAGGSYKNVWGFFPSSVGLLDILTDLNPLKAAAEMASLNSYRFNSSEVATPFNDSSTARGDYAFINQGDAFYHQSIVRQKNAGISSATPTSYQVLPDSENAKLASRFCLQRSSMGDWGSLEKNILPTSLVGNTVPYTDPQAWFAQNFNYDKVVVGGNAAPASVPVRALLVANNGISPTVPIDTTTPLPAPNPAIWSATQMLPTDPSSYKGKWIAGSTYNLNYVVQGADNRTYIYVSNTPGNTAADPGSPAATVAGIYQYGSQWQPQSWSQVSTGTPMGLKSCVNTATFRELYRAFFWTMAGNPTTQTPFGTGVSPQNNPYTPTADPQHMFRSPLRDPNYDSTNPSTATRMDGRNTLMLRAAMASLNAIALRNAAQGQQDVLSKSVYLNANIAGVAADVEARIYSNAPQPFISEVFVESDETSGDPNAGGKANPHGYIAVELYNPYPFDITLTNFQIATIDRHKGVAFPLALTAVTTTPFTVAKAMVIKSQQYVLLENYDAANAPVGNNATFRPSSSGLSPTGPPNAVASPNYQDVFVDGLDQAMNKELVLLRTRRADGQFSSSSTAPAPDPSDVFNEGSVTAPTLNDMVPVDSFDFTGFQPVNAPPFTIWHYIRGKGTGQLFKSTYPGRYNGTLGTAPTSPRQEAKYKNFDPASYPTSTDTTLGTTMWFTASPSDYLNNFAPVQIANQGMPGPTPKAASANQFPFGGFARMGDILQTTYIGAYRITQVSNGNIIEVNSLPMDCSFADDGDNADDAMENIGRFCPLNQDYANYLPKAGAAPGTYGPYAGFDYYFWAKNLFTYLSVYSAHDDYAPNVDPAMNELIVVGGVAPTASSNVYPPQAPTNIYNSDIERLYSDPLAGPTIQNNQLHDYRAPAEGLININTASWEVLNSLPLVVGDRAKNELLAKAIVAWRETYGPFHSIYDLNQVVDISATNLPLAPGTPDAAEPKPGFQNEYGLLWDALTNKTATTPTTNDGLLNPPDTVTGATTGKSTAVATDFQWQFAQINRISNLVTTRSDTFTVYICVEGWANANTASASLKIQRRYAFTVDRSHVTPEMLTHFAKTMTIPND